MTSLKMSFKFTQEGALVYKKNLILSDIHIGIEYDIYKSGISIPSQTNKIVEKILKICKREKTEKILILGDVKHKVPGISLQEKKEVPEFFQKISNQHFKNGTNSQKIKVEVIPGNHDSGLENLVDIKIHQSIGIKLDDIYLTHGHSWPDKSFLDCKYIIVGHTHPMIEIKDKIGYKHKKRVWIRGNLKKKIIKEKYGKQTKAKLIMLPAFNEFSGGIVMNSKWLEEGEKQKRFIGPIVKSFAIENAEAFLLDGTYLGLVKDL